MTKKTCIVVGAGIVGSSCAWHLQKAGFEVSLVDNQQPGQVTSFGNAGCISPSSIVPFSYPGVMRDVPAWLLKTDGPLKIRWRDLPTVAPWLWRFWRAGKMATVERIAASVSPMMHRVHAAYDEILQASGSTGLIEKRGCLVIYDNEEKWRKSQWQFDLIRRHGFSVREVEAAELAELEPDVHAPYGRARLYEDWHHLLNPGEVSKRIADLFISNGGELINDRVKKITANGVGVTAMTESGKTLSADRLVCAAGVWSNFLAKQLDGEVPMTAKRGYHSMLPQPEINLNRPIYFASRMFIATPMQHGLRLAGTGEFARIDAPANYDRARGMVKTAQQYLPGLSATNATEWMGQRPMMPDSLPVISHSQSHPGKIIYAFGHGHYGLTQGPLTGQLVAKMAAGQDPGIDMRPFRIDRF